VKLINKLINFIYCHHEHTISPFFLAASLNEYLSKKPYIESNLNYKNDKK